MIKKKKKEPHVWKDAQQGRMLSSVQAALDTEKPAGHWARKGCTCTTIVLGLSMVRNGLLLACCGFLCQDNNF